MTVLEALAVTVREEIHNTHDEPLTEKEARYVAAALLVGMENRGWTWTRKDGPEINVKVGGYGLASATVEQVERTHGPRASRFEDVG